MVSIKFSVRRRFSVFVTVLALLITLGNVPAKTLFEIEVQE